MTKAILVIDMPSSCEYCQFISGTNDEKGYTEWRCEINKEVILNYRYKLGSCPLKPLPEKTHKNGGCRVIDGKEWWYDSDHDDGWNDCIDEILGEEE